MKCKDCYKEGCPQRAYTTDAECVLQQWTAKQFDWLSFRAEAAKDILCSMIQGGYGQDRIEHQSELAAKYANALITKLKEKEN